MQISFTKSSEVIVNVAVKGHEHVLLCIRLNSVIFCWSLIIGIQVIYLGVVKSKNTV